MSFSRVLSCCFQLWETLQNVWLVQHIRYFYLLMLPGQQNWEIYSSILSPHCLIKLKNCSGYVPSYFYIGKFSLYSLLVLWKKGKKKNQEKNQTSPKLNILFFNTVLFHRLVAFAPCLNCVDFSKQQFLLDKQKKVIWMVKLGYFQLWSSLHILFDRYLRSSGRIGCLIIILTLKENPCFQSTDDLFIQFWCLGLWGKRFTFPKCAEKCYFKYQFVH